jgi:hypothetical protein
MSGVEETALARLCGRGLFASQFWTVLTASCLDADAGARPADLVRAALERTYASATTAAAFRMNALWKRHTPAAGGQVPSRLLRYLFYELIMASSEAASLARMHMHADVRECIQRGILNASGDDRSLALEAEPVTAAALRQLGVQRIQANEDGVAELLAARVTEPAGSEVADFGPAQEACLAWALVRACISRAAEGRAPLTLAELLGPFLARDDSMVEASGGVHPELLPPAIDNLVVDLKHGHRCDGDEWRDRCPLSLLAEHPSTLLHHPDNGMGGPDIMFPARDRITGQLRPVLLQLKNRAYGGLADALRSVDVGAWYTDRRELETPAHANMRRALAANPAWALPIRGVVGARAVHSNVLLDVAWLNNHELIPSPVLLLQLTRGNMGVDIIAPRADEKRYARTEGWPVCLWPSPVRHWDVGARPLPALQRPAVHLTPAASLCVKLTSTAAADVMVGAVEAFARELGGSVTCVRHRNRNPFQTRRSITATFTRAVTSFAAVERAGRDGPGRLTAGGHAIHACFVS